jgi:hypothetical protein
MVRILTKKEEQEYKQREGRAIKKAMDSQMGGKDWIAEEQRCVCRKKN